MEQKIEITLEDLLELKDKILSLTEAYQKLIGEYKLLSYVYQQLTYQPEEEKVKKKNKIGFQPSKEI